MRDVPPDTPRDYPLHLVRGDEFAAEGRLMRHEVLRNTHKLTVLDSLTDVDAFVAAGKQVVFLSHQWTSFAAPDAGGEQYEVMRTAIRDLARQRGVGSQPEGRVCLGGLLQYPPGKPFYKIYFPIVAP